MGQPRLNESLRAVEAELAAGRPQQALPLAQELLARFPRAYAVQRTLGEIYLALRKPREALAALDRALSADPEDARACCARAIVHQMHGDTAAALAWYRRACDIRPEDLVLRATYHELATHLGQPPYQPARLGLARLYLRSALYVHAIREWEALIAENPDALDAQVGLAETLWRAQRTAAAEERCNRILANAPACVRALLLAAVIAHDSGRHDEAARLVRRAAEVDPDVRIGQALLADRLAAGDRGLRQLLLGEAPPTRATQGTGPLAPDATRRGVSRPLVDVRAAEQEAAARRAAGDATVPLPASAGPRSAAVPPEFHTIFRETAFMIWGPEEEAEAARRETGAVPAFERSRTEPFARSSQLIPPALAEQGATMDDSEARAAINFVNWLQAQGAQVRDRAGQPTGGTQRGMGTRPLGGARPPAAPPRPARAATGPLLPPHATGPLPPPTPEALQAMFAELDPEPAKARIVDADLTPPRAPEPEPPATVPEEQPEAWSASQAEPAGWAREDAEVPAYVPISLDDHEPAYPSEPAAPTHATPGEAAPLTLEALEQQFAASGFRTYEPPPGGLAALSPQPGAAARVAVAVEESAAQAEPTTGPADYPARLEQARTRRAAGQLDDALAHYRTVLRHAPDLLADVVHDLGECVAETPQHPEVHRLLGDARIRSGDYLGALESYNRAVALTQAQEP